MKLLLVALLCAISYAQTGRAQAQAGGQQGSYQQGGYPQTNGQPGGGGYQPGGYPQNNRQQGGSPQWPPKTGMGSTAGGPPQNQAGPGGMQGGMVPQKTMADCTTRDQEMCPRKRLQTLCEADVCCIFEWKDSVPNCYGYQDAPFNAVECKDYPQQACDESKGCAWSTTEYECDTKFNAMKDLTEECMTNPSNPECYNKNQEAGMMCGALILVFLVGCCCGYCLGPKKRA